MRYREAKNEEEALKKFWEAVEEEEVNNVQVEGVDMINGFYIIGYYFRGIYREYQVKKI